MNTLTKLSKHDIVTKYLGKPILIDIENIKEWYIVSDVQTIMPLHLLTQEESDLYDQDKNNIKGIEVAGVNSKGYLMWIYFNDSNGWDAFGYE